MLQQTRGDYGLGAGAVEAGEVSDGFELRSFAALKPGEGRGHALCLFLVRVKEDGYCNEFMKTRIRNWTNHVDGSSKIDLRDTCSALVSM